MLASPTPTYHEISPSVGIYTIETPNHKTARLSIYTIWHAQEDASPMLTLLFGILRRGSLAYPKLSLLNRRLDDLYGTTLTMRNFLIGDKHILSFTAEMLEDAYLPQGEMCDILSGTMEVLSEMLCRPLLDGQGLLRADVVEQEKISLCDSIRADINDPRSYASMRHRLAMCEGEPYGVSLWGDIPQIMALTPQEVTLAYQAFSQNATWKVYYTGQATHERVEKCFRQAFGHHFMTPKVIPPTMPHRAPSKPRYVEDSLAVEQGRLCISWTKSSVTPQDHPATVVLCELLGVMQSAILFRTVREELGLCYDCDAAYEPSKGILTVTSGIHPKNRQAAEEAILKALQQIAEGHLDPMDVTLAQLSLKNVYEQVAESPASLEAYWFRHGMEGMEIPPHQMLEQLMAVTCEQVIAVAEQFVLDTVYFLQATGQVEEVDV